MKEKESMKFTCRVAEPIDKTALRPEEYEMYEVVENFSRQMISYMHNQDVDVENAIPTATQELGHSYFLQKKRLRKRGILLHYAKYMRFRNNGNLYVKYLFENRDKYVVCAERQEMDTDIRFVRARKMIGRICRRGYKKHYILRYKNANGLYACPSCGSVSTLDVLLDGCDYCKSKFDISAYDNKVASVCEGRTTRYFGEKNLKMNRKAGILSTILAPLIVASLILLVAIMVLFAQDAHIAIRLFFSLFFLLMSVVVGAVMYFFLLFYTNNSDKIYKRFDEINDLIQKNNPDFDVDEFAASMDSKLKAIFYADENKDVSAFVLCDLNKFIQHSQNVVDCEINQIEFTDYRTDATYQYIDVLRVANLQRDCGDRVVSESRTIKVTLCKKRKYRMKREVVLYRCPNCGASISLKEGGICKFCDSKMDYMLYDWAIKDITFVAPNSYEIRVDV